MSFFVSSILTLTNMIDIVNFIIIIMIIRIFDVIVIIDFFVENTVLNVNVLNFSSYLTR